jgi:hypothetical protein
MKIHCKGSSGCCASVSLSQVQFEECSQLAIHRRVGCYAQIIRVLSTAMQGLRRALDAGAVGLPKRDLRTMSPVLRARIDFVAAELLSASRNLENIDGFGRKTPQV